MFHFQTTESAAASGGGGTGAFGFWQLVLQNWDNPSGGNTAEVYEDAYGDGTRTGVVLVNATQSGDAGFDLTLPFTPAGTTLRYNFYVNAAGYAADASLAQNASLTGSISATLHSVEAVTANGTHTSWASFDPVTGLGSISATPDITATPEPGTLVLLGTGLVGLVPVVHRRKQ